MIPVEFSRPFVCDKIGGGTHRVSIAANEAECAALATRFGIPGVRSLACDYELERGLDATRAEIVAQGRIGAVLVRICVVSLEEFDETMSEEFQVRFVRAGTEREETGPEEPDEIPYEFGLLDLGEAAAEQVALDMEPYPRMPGAVLPPEATDEDLSPFAALKARLPS